MTQHLIWVVLFPKSQLRNKKKNDEIKMGLLSQTIRSSSVRVAMLSQRGDNFNVLADTA